MITSNGNDFLNGGAGNDNLTSGNDGTLTGGTGDDIYNIGRFTTGVLIVENAGEGIDTVLSSKPIFSLAALPHVENLNFVNADASDTGHLTGNDLDNVLRGSDTTTGDTLIGGFGADTMIGLRRGDRYFVDNAGDVVVEQASVRAGIDMVNASIDYTLAANVENLTANSTAGAVADRQRPGQRHHRRRRRRHARWRPRRGYSCRGKAERHLRLHHARSAAAISTRSSIS